MMNRENNKQKHFDCKNCDKTFRHEFSNGGYTCTGIVKLPFRNCDVIRVCHKFDDGNISAVDLSLDEAFIQASAISFAATNYLRCVYKRPCTRRCDKIHNCDSPHFKKRS